MYFVDWINKKKYILRESLGILGIENYFFLIVKNILFWEFGYNRELGK